LRVRLEGRSLRVRRAAEEKWSRTIQCQAKGP